MSGDEFSLAGRVVLLTGAAGLIGREVADALAAHHGRLAVTDLAPDREVAKAAGTLRDRHPGLEVLPISADLTREDDVERLFRSVLQRFGRVDVLIHLAARNAQMGNDRQDIVADRTFERFPVETWRRSLEANGTATLRVTQAAVRCMLATGVGGNIVLAASTYSLVAPNPELYAAAPGEPAPYKPIDYVATKSMVPGLVRYVAARYGARGIRCNAIAPHGVVDGHGADFRDRFARLSPLRRMCRVSELRGPFVFLASEASSYMTGTVLTVDGGWTAW